jgi:hypothetical protein
MTQIMQITLSSCKAIKGIKFSPKRQFKLSIAGTKITSKSVEIAK